MCHSVVVDRNCTEEKARKPGTAEDGVAMGTYHGDRGCGRRRGRGGGGEMAAPAVLGRLGILHRKRISSLEGQGPRYRVLVANYKMKFGLHIYAKNTGQRVIICTRGKNLVPVQHFRIRKMAQKLWDIADRHIILCNVSDIPLKQARRQD